jgi:hypothetical protein
VKAQDPDGDDDELDLPPAEAERDRRRDHDLRAAEREGMRTGLAKQFKQVLDAQAKRAREAEEELLVEERRSREPKGSHRPRRTVARPPE